MWDTDWRGAASQYQRAMSPRGREVAGGIPLEGFRLIERAVAAGHTPTLVIAAATLLADPPARFARLLRRLEALPGMTRVAAPADVIAELVEGRTFGDVVALVPAPPPLALDEALAQAHRPVALLVAAEIQDPGNTGALVRTALAGGAAGFVALGGADPFHPKAIRTSMGSIFKLPVLHLPLEDAAVLRSACGRAGVALIGLVTSGGAPLWEVRVDERRPALVVGGEAFGLSPPVRGLMDALGTIPMAEQVDSFSVNAAASIALYEWRRRAGIAAAKG
ncbi:MAG: RNA methyltransferase [Deltaproteobacteria bacterium]|nr:MAG: RNA methyltransferase [Deltaproteobacteria bacterium]